MPSLKVLTWNMNRSQGAWERLSEIRATEGAQVALVQEAVPPPTPGWRVHPAKEQADAWRVSAHADRKRAYASAVVLLDDNLTMAPVEPLPLGEADYGAFAVSHPGQFAVSDVRLPDGAAVTFISLYGIWDKDERWLFSEPSLHRAISDLTIVLQARDRSNVVLAGDLNIYWQWERAATGATWAPRYNTVFDRLAAYGLTLAGPFGDSALDRCACGRGPDCRHVRTFAFNRNPDNKPYQLDFLFTSQALGPAPCRVLDGSAWKHSDHLPVLAEVRLP